LTAPRAGPYLRTWYRAAVGPGKENFDVKAGRSSFVFIKEEGD
jgi:hypothetical protein